MRSPNDAPSHRLRCPGLYVAELHELQGSVLCAVMHPCCSITSGGGFSGAFRGE